MDERRKKVEAKRQKAERADACALPTFCFSLCPFALNFFLAARSTSSDKDSGKFIFGVIFAIIWFVFAVISKLNKKPQQQRPMQLPPLPPPTSGQTPPMSQGGTISMEEALRMRREQAQRMRQEQIRLKQLQRQAQQRPGARPIATPRAPAQQRRAAQQPPPLRQAGAPARVAQTPRDAGNKDMPQLPHESTGSLTSTATAFPESLQKQVSASEIGGTRTPAAVAAAAQAARKLPSASAPLIARWLKPNTLRSQFILTEVLQPPLGMREPRF
jgi:hypothetical protein